MKLAQLSKPPVPSQLGQVQGRQAAPPGPLVAGDVVVGVPVCVQGCEQQLLATHSLEGCMNILNVELPDAQAAVGVLPTLTAAIQVALPPEVSKQASACSLCNENVYPLRYF